MGLFNKNQKTTKTNDQEKYKKVSYSQSGEDMIVKHIFQSLNIEKPSYIDIGAHHPFYINNTAVFYLSGSTGINIEPDPVLFSKFPLLRKNDINLNIGISDTEGESDFYIINTPTLNTFSKETAESYSQIGDYKIVDVKRIKTQNIEQIIKSYSNGIFPDFLSIDAEGVDELILNSINFDSENCPKVICIETVSFSENGRGEKNKDLIKMIESKGYLYYSDTNINSIFVLKKIWER